MTTVDERPATVCPAPEDHDWLFRSSELTWRERATGKLKRLNDLCPFCGLLIRRMS